jgi:ribosomal protein L5
VSHLLPRACPGWAAPGGDQVELVVGSSSGRGNYSLGLREQLAFPEIDYDKIDRLRGLEVSIITSAQTDEESKRLLQLLGMPFAS